MHIYVFIYIAQYSDILVYVVTYVHIVTSGFYDIGHMVQLKGNVALIRSTRTNILELAISSYKACHSKVSPH